MSQTITITLSPSSTDGVAPAVASATALGAAPASLEPPLNGLYAGEIRLLPFRHNQLPFGWYFCNGERFLLNSPQGGVLSALTDEFRADWGITEDMCSISVPKLFHEDGRGCFMRAVNGDTRQVGAWEGDAIRNITGSLGYNDEGGLVDKNSTLAWSGVFGCDLTRKRSYSVAFDAQYGGYHAAFDASRVVPTAEENRPLNLGMTPAIYLGV